jgi:HAD superfamily hydrolase (TIGR01484 family)
MKIKLKLAIFDIDGTIANKGVIPPEVISGIKHLHDIGCITSISTGRGYVRLREVFGDNFDNLISPQSLIIIEHGTKIVDHDGNIIIADYFKDSEIEHVVDFLRANIGIFKLVWFNPIDVTKKIPVWCADEKDVQAETQKRGHYADVFTCSIGELEESLLKQKLTNISLKLKDYVKVENLKLSFTRTDTNIIFQDGNMEFIKNNINKGLALAEVLRKLNIDSSELLIAGNAINDVEMLDYEAGYKILVSKGEDRATILSYLSSPESIIKVDTPEELGHFLLSIK